MELLTTEARVSILYWACRNIDGGEVGPVLAALLVDVPDDVEERLVQWRDERMVPAVQGEAQAVAQQAQQVLTTLLASREEEQRPPRTFDEARAATEAASRDAEPSTEPVESGGA